MMQSSIAVISIVNDEFLEGPEKFELCFQPTDDYKRKNINRGDPKLAIVTIIDDPNDGGWILCYTEHSRLLYTWFCICIATDSSLSSSPNQLKEINGYCHRRKR